MLEGWFWPLMVAVACGTSIVSGILGMAGGLLLLAALLTRLEPVVAIPIHGIIQLVSNGSRAVFLRRHVRWAAVLRFSWPLLPAGALGLVLLRWIPASAGRVLIGVFVLLATWVPGVMHFAGRNRPERALPLGGALVGFFSTLVGATGPLLGPFIVALELAPQGTVATLAACQIFQHSSKVLLFGVTGFDFARLLLPVAALSLAALLGSAIGTRLLDRVKGETFRLVVKITLSMLSVELLVSALWEIVRG